MRISRLKRWTTRRVTPWLLLLLIGGCSGLEPYEPRDDREEGPKKGLISGDTGEFVIYER
jgi:hypothetical protein